MPKLKLSKRPWLRTTLLVLCLIAFIVAVWVAGPMIPVLVFGTIWLRLLITVIVLGVAGAIWFIRWRRRKRAADALEQAIIPTEPTGDGVELAERMQSALATLKKSGGASYLYDLPWYVIIGPPGAGKTTALVNSGIEFPLAGDAAAGLEGFGGTRFCDWWFAEDAILIDTAGRYTTQDSDAVADETSWQAFLDLLKKSRPNQPINGVILAFSVEDMMTSNAESLARHAETVRARLAEVHETLKIDFPVYVLFTKADLISGFREFFSSFSMARRNGVWGVTFQSKDRKALTHEGVADEFDALVGRLSDEVIDRLNEEPDGVARIAIFGLPGQMALMRDSVSEFLRLVFEPTRYKTNAMLRGFYFTSGTQEGTPIDQVLGAMSRIGEGAGGFASSFMSGKGKSFFIHDLLRKVIFEERDWVSFDRRAVRRTAIFRGVSISLITVATVCLVAALSFSYWQNATLVAYAHEEVEKYERAGVDEITRQQIDEIQLETVLPLLEDIRAMPAGYGQAEETTIWETFGLSQRRRLQEAASKSYSHALEKMLRPRMMMTMEQQMPYIINDGETTEIYRALKVYMLLAGLGERNDDDAIKSYFDDMWRGAFQGREGIDIRDQLTGHLDAMLILDDQSKLLVQPDGKTITDARAEIVQLPVVDQAYALIMDGAKAAGLRDWILTERTGSTANLVFETKDGSDISTLKIDGIFTYEGFWSYFFPQLEVVADRLREDQWVLDDEGVRADTSDQINRLDRALQERYRKDFKDEWEGMFANMALASMAADKPRYNALGAAASASASPILMLVREVDAETKLTREFEGLEDLTPEMLAGTAVNTDAGGIGANVSGSVVGRMRSRSSGVQRILMDAVLGKGKKAGGISGGSGSNENSVSRPIERIEEEFTMWHELLEGEPGQRAIDAVLGNLGQVWNNLRLAARNPGQSAVLMPQLLNNLTQYNSQMPPTLAGLVNEADRDFQKGASDANLATMNRALTDKITFFCRETITSSYPFAKSQRSVSLDNFTKFFGPGGDMDDFYNTYLSEFVERTPDGLRYLQDKPLTARLSPGTLRQFDRAQRIRQAFFSGGTTPQVEITVAHVDSHPSIESAKLVINDMEIPTAKGDSPKTVVWPGEGKATLLALEPTLDRASGLQLRGSSWTFIEFLRSASSRNQRGDTMRATYTVGGRNITYDFTINAVVNPFTMRELRDFKCPKSLD